MSDTPSTPAEHADLIRRLQAHAAGEGPAVPFVSPPPGTPVFALHLGDAPAEITAPRVEAFIPDDLGWRQCGCPAEKADGQMDNLPVMLAVVTHAPTCRVEYAETYPTISWPPVPPEDEKEALMRELEDEARDRRNTPYCTVPKRPDLSRVQQGRRGEDATREADEAMARWADSAATLPQPPFSGDAGDLFERADRIGMDAHEALHADAVASQGRLSPADEVAVAAARLNDAIIAASRAGFDVQTQMAVAQLPTGEVSLIDIVRTIRPVATVAGLASNALYRAQDRS